MELRNYYFSQMMILYESYTLSVLAPDPDIRNTSIDDLAKVFRSAASVLGSDLAQDILTSAKEKATSHLLEREI